MTVELHVVSTRRLVMGILDLLGRGWRIERVHEEGKQRFMITAFMITATASA